MTNYTKIYKNNTEASISNEALLAGGDILLLAHETIPESDYVDAERFASMLTGMPSQKEAARLALTSVLLPLPKISMYDLSHELFLLPHKTRVALLVLGNYVDILTKAAVYGKCHDKSIFKVSFGPTIDVFSKCYPDNIKLASWLAKYNRFFYHNARYDFTIPPGRTVHRFSSREVVLCLFITRELVDSIKSLSDVAMRVSYSQPI